MTTQIDYEAIARENGYGLHRSVTMNHWRYVTPNLSSSTGLYNSPEEAYKACCVENNLIKGESHVA